MSINVDGKLYYQTSEAAHLAGISRSTLMRWLDKGIIKDTTHRDRRGWRIFVKDEIKTISREAHKFQS